MVRGLRYRLGRDLIPGGNAVTITRDFEQNQPVAIVTVYFPVSCEAAAIEFVSNASIQDVERGVKKMAKMEDFAIKFNQELAMAMVTVNAKAPPDYSQYAPKHRR